MHDALDAFLDSHAGETHRDDVGPLFGQARVLCDRGIADAESKRLWYTAVSVAVSSEATREGSAAQRRSKASRSPL